MQLPEIAASGNNFRHRFRHRVNGSVIRTPAGKVRVEAIRHHGNRIGFSVRNRNLGHHGLGLRQLILSAVGHQRTGGTDGRIKHLHQPLLGAAVQIRQSIQPCLLYIRNVGTALQSTVFLIRDIHKNSRLLMRPVGIQESAGQVDNSLTPPVQNQPGLLCDNRDLYCLQIFLMRIGQELVCVLRIHHYSHSLLRLGNGKLCSVQTFIFLRNLVQIHLQTGSQLADCDRNAAGAEIITLFYNGADLRTAEHPLDLTLGRCISLLYLCPTCLKRRCLVRLGGTGGSPDSVTSGPSPKKNDYISRIRIFPDHCFSGRGAHNCADLHTFCHILRMIDFFYISGSQAHLVSIRAVAFCCSSGQCFLGELAFQRLRGRSRRICRSGHPHCLVHIGSSGKRIPDSASQAGGRPSERLNLGRMIMRLIFKIDQPLLAAAVHIDRDDNAAGIDFVRFLLIGQFPVGLQLFCCQTCQIHQAEILVLSPFIKNPVIIDISFQ